MPGCGYCVAARTVFIPTTEVLKNSGNYPSFEVREVDITSNEGMEEAESLKIRAAPTFAVKTESDKIYIIQRGFNPKSKSNTLEKNLGNALILEEKDLPKGE